VNGSPLRILLVDDDEDDYVLVRSLLARTEDAEYRLDWAASYEDGLRGIKETRHDAYLLDFHLGTRTGLELLKEAGDCKAPVIVLTAHGSHRKDMESMKAGAADYLDKASISSPLLERSIRYAIERKSAQDRIRAEHHKFMSILDAMNNAVFIINSRHEITYLNPKAETEFGTVNGRKCHAYFHDLPEQCSWCRNEEILNGKTILREWVSSINSRSYETFETPLSNGDEAASKLEILHDITDRKKAQAALQESEKRLRALSAKLLTIQEEERANIARYLHDSIGQTLAAVKFGLENALSATRPQNGEAAVKSLSLLVPMIQSGIEEIRAIYMGLRPTILDDFGIAATIAWHCRLMGETSPQIKVETQIDLRESDLPASLKTVIYRVVQEVLNNVVKHSGATLVKLFLGHVGDGIELTIGDNGRGFDMDEVLDGDDVMRGLGLASMQERVEQAGGSFSIRSAKGQGAVIRATWTKVG
jgi:signal transduction histidine kinase